VALPVHPEARHVVALAGFRLPLSVGVDRPDEVDPVGLPAGHQIRGPGVARVHQVLAREEIDPGELALDRVEGHHV